MTAKQTDDIVDVISGTLVELGLSPQRETPYRPGDRSRLCDVTASALPDGKPVFRFEIDQEKPRAAWNDFTKWFHRSYDPADLPAIHFSVLWGSAADFESSLDSYYSPYRLPPGFITTISFEPVDGWEQDLKSRIVAAIAGSRSVGTDGTNTPEDVIKGYRPMIKYGAYEVAARTLAARLKDSWASYYRHPDRQSLWGAATLECAHARLLQQVGRIPGARRSLHRIHQAVPFREWYKRLPEGTADLATYLRYRLEDVHAPSEITSLLKQPANQAKAMWRCPPPEARDNPGVLDGFLDSYLEKAGRLLIPLSNTYFARVKIALSKHDWETAAQYARLYADQQIAIIGDPGIPDGGTGPLTAVFLQVLVRLLSQSGNKKNDASAFLKGWDALRRDFGVEMLADGLRDLELVRFSSDLLFLGTAERSEKREKNLAYELCSARFERLQDLWGKANVMVDGSSRHR